MHDQVAVILKAIEFIESHLKEDISVAQIADAAGYSLFHFMRKFNQVVHHTPYDYLMRRRLTESAKALIRSEQRIIDIAQDFGFNDQETFSRVFRKMFQMTPSQCRKVNGIPFQFLLQAKTHAELKFINSDHFSTPLVVEEDDLTLLGLMTALDDNDKKAANLRKQVCDDFLSEISLQENAQIYEIEIRLNQQTGKRYCFVGAEKNQIQQESALFVSQTIHKGRFVKMEVPESELSLASAYLHTTWIPRVGLVENLEMTICSWKKEKSLKERALTILIPVK
ncbi:MAG: helix-turn-helix transcriptional regulator [Anaerolineae bacterium]|nr:helix-turn-helix transcriptional regulator [Anaerolineae bacterium]